MNTEFGGGGGVSILTGDFQNVFTLQISIC